MTAALWILLVVLIVSAVLARRGVPFARPAAFAVVLAVVYVSATRVQRFLEPGDLRAPVTAADELIGLHFGKAVAAAHPEGGRILVLQYAVMANDPTGRAQIKGLRRGLRSKAYDVELAQVGAQGGEQPEGAKRGASAEEHLRAFTDAADSGIAVVAFLPVLESLDFSLLDSERPLYTYETAFREPWQVLLEEGQVAGIALPKHWEAEAESRNAGAGFEDRFEWRTAP